MNNNKYAFATLVTKTKYEASAGRMFEVFKYYNSKYPLIIMVDENLTDKDLPFLTSHKIPYRKIPITKFNATNNVLIERYGDTFSKFYFCNYIEYDYICFVDADILLGNIDIISLFDKIKLNDDHVFFYCSTNKRRLGECFILKPSINLYEKILTYNNEVTDEALLWKLFPDKDIDINEYIIDLTKLNMYHFSGFLKPWELFAEHKDLYIWFYNSDIKIYLQKLDSMVKYKLLPMLNLIYQLAVLTGDVVTEVTSWK